jgi:hypothetical protein
VVRLTWPQAIGWHMRQHRLDRRAQRADLLRVATEHGGLHAQVMSSAELIAWCRVADLREGDVTRALWQERKLVKTWAMRHTLHLVPASGYWEWIAVASSLPSLVNPSWIRRLRLSDDELAAVVAAVSEALSRGPLWRNELLLEIARATGSARVEKLLQESWGINLLKPACMQGMLCFAQGEGARSRFIHPAIYLRRRKPARPSNGLRNIARQFFRTCGPATAREFSRWLCLDSARTKQTIAELAGELELVDVEGEPAWMIAADVAEVRNALPERTVRLLPSFDPYVFGAFSHSERYLRGGAHTDIYKGSAWYAAVLFAEGGFAGVWSMKKAPDRLSISIEPFRAAPRWLKKGAEAEAALMAQSMNRKLELKWVN